MNKKTVNENIIESMLMLMPYMSKAEAASMLEYIGNIFEQHPEIDGRTIHSLSEPENEFTRCFCKFFTGLDDSIKPHFIADVVEIMDKWKEF
jgi:hypothetical protein